MFSIMELKDFVSFVTEGFVSIFNSFILINIQVWGKQFLTYNLFLFPEFYPSFPTHLIKPLDATYLRYFSPEQ